MERNTYGNGANTHHRNPPVDVDDALQFTPLSSVVPFAAGNSSIACISSMSLEKACLSDIIESNLVLIYMPFARIYSDTSGEDLWNFTYISRSYRKGTGSACPRLTQRTG